MGDSDRRQKMSRSDKGRKIVYNEEVEVQDVPANAKRPDPTALRLAATTKGISSASGSAQHRSMTSSNSAKLSGPGTGLMWATSTQDWYQTQWFQAH